MCVMANSYQGPMTMCLEIHYHESWDGIAIDTLGWRRPYRPMAHHSLAGSGKEVTDLRAAQGKIGAGTVGRR